VKAEHEEGVYIKDDAPSEIPSIMIGYFTGFKYDKF
jgi:hypothetical protein